MSVGGALVQVGEWLDLPPAVELRVKHGARYRSAVRHRSLDRAGLRFVDQPA